MYLKYLIDKIVAHKVKHSDTMSVFIKPIREIQEYLSTPFYNDELQSLITQEKGNPSDRIVTNISEGVVDITDQAGLTNYIIINIQLNHGWVVGSDLQPHIHWFQNQNKVPNLLLQYRWQINGEEKTDAWQSLPWERLIKDYPTEGTPTVNSIIDFGRISPPPTAKLSEIIQFRIIRDVANASNLFSGVDDYAGNVSLVNFDAHILIDSFGSRLVYQK